MSPRGCHKCIHSIVYWQFLSESDHRGDADVAEHHDPWTAYVAHLGSD